MGREHVMPSHPLTQVGPGSGSSNQGHMDGVLETGPQTLIPWCTYRVVHRTQLLKWEGISE